MFCATYIIEIQGLSQSFFLVHGKLQYLSHPVPRPVLGSNFKTTCDNDCDNDKGILTLLRNEKLSDRYLRSTEHIDHVIKIFGRLA